MLLTLGAILGCTSGSYAPNAQVDRAVLGPAPVGAASAVTPATTKPTAVASESALVSLPPTAALTTHLVWPTLSSELRGKRLAAQLHVLDRAAVREPKASRRAGATRRSNAASPRALGSAASHDGVASDAAPSSEAVPSNVAPSDAAPNSEAGARLDEAAPTGEEKLTADSSAVSDSSERCEGGSVDGAHEPSREVTGGHDPSAAAPSLLDGSAGELSIRPILIENESALLAFHAALARLAHGEDPPSKVRILAYGASHTQADFYPGYLRAYLQSRFGNGGRGFVLLGRVNSWHSTLDTRMRQRGLAMHHARFRRDPTSEPLGLFGAALVGRNAGSFAEILTAADSDDTRFELQYYQELGGGDFVVELDGKRLARITTQPDRAGPAYFAFEAPRGQHRIQVRLAATGPVRLFGVVAETAAPGVVIDTLGISGARMADSLQWDDASFIDAVRRRQPDLITLAYGTNEAFDTSLSIEQYQADARSVLARLRRATPTASCLFIAPFDLPSARRAQLLRIVDAQRRLAQENGCGFWNGLSFMGGEGSINSWVKAKPSLAARDHIHLTRRGYVLAGTALADALLREYDLEASQAASGHAVEPSPLLIGKGP